MRIFAGYGSTKDISVYTAIGIPSSQIYIVGRPSKKLQSQCQVPILFCIAREIGLAFQIKNHLFQVTVDCFFFFAQGVLVFRVT